MTKPSQNRRLLNRFSKRIWFVDKIEIIFRYNKSKLTIKENETKIKKQDKNRNIKYYPFYRWQIIFSSSWLSWSGISSLYLTIVRSVDTSLSSHDDVVILHCVLFNKVDRGSASRRQRFKILTFLSALKINLFYIFLYTSTWEENKQLTTTNHFEKRLVPRMQKAVPCGQMILLALECLPSLRHNAFWKATEFRSECQVE